MPLTEILVLGLIVFAFALFGATLAWGDHQTRDIARASRQKALAGAQVISLSRRTAYAEHKTAEKAEARDVVTQT